MRPGSSRGVSNQLVDTEATVTVEAGVLLAALASGAADVHSVERELEDVQRQLVALTERMGVLTKRLAIEQAERSVAPGPGDASHERLAGTGS